MLAPPTIHIPSSQVHTYLITYKLYQHIFLLHILMHLCLRITLPLHPTSNTVFHIQHWRFISRIIPKRTNTSTTIFSVAFSLIGHKFCKFLRYILSVVCELQHPVHLHKLKSSFMSLIVLAK